MAEPMNRGRSVRPARAGWCPVVVLVAVAFQAGLGCGRTAKDGNTTETSRPQGDPPVFAAMGVGDIATTDRGFPNADRGFPTTTRGLPVTDLAETPATRPAVVVPPKVIPEGKIIPDGEKATLIYPCRHAQTTILQQAVEGLLSPEGTAHASPALNALVVSDQKEVVESLLRVLQELDAPRHQLLVEARVVEVSATRDLEYEIRHAFTTPPGRSTFLQNSEVNLPVPGASNPGQGLDVALRVWDQDGKKLDTFVRLLNTRGRARILSSPNLIVAPGEEASIITGEEVPVQSSTIAGGSITTATQFKRVGIKLRVHLLQLTDDTARVEINPEVSNVTGFTAGGEGQAPNPIIAIRNVTSTLSLKDGEVLTVGGLLRNEKRRTTRGVPVLEDIPVAGLLFQSRFDSMVRSQLIFFLRVRIVSDGEAETIRAHRPGAGLEKLDPISDPLTLPKGEGKMPPNLRPIHE